MDYLESVDDLKRFVALEELKRPRAGDLSVPFIPNLRIIYPQTNSVDLNNLGDDYSMLKDMTSLTINDLDLTLDEFSRRISIVKANEAPIRGVYFMKCSREFPLKGYIDIVAREFGRDLRIFTCIGHELPRSPNLEKLGLTDECMEILVKHCPYIESMTLHNCCLTGTMATLMRSRWIGTMRYLDVSPGYGKDPFFMRKIDNFVQNKDHEDEHHYFFFDECFSD